MDIDLNEDGDKEDVADLTIEYDAEKYADTNGLWRHVISLLSEWNLRKVWNGIWKIWITQMTGPGLTAMEMLSVMKLWLR